MAEIINLRQVRKRKEKTEKEAKAEQNRILFGRTKAEREKAKLLEEKAAKFIDGHKREDKGDK
ncbi:DUF4169 family protein [Microvirga sp. W0021]|uniref:DUF4169 family protein n=1 Tax=Hohaiivirga grylli TaxID=3133970 RepID=A0ABV0BMC7_9HYPH